jgi:hypothetical protein
MRDEEKKNLKGMLNSELIKHIRNLHKKLKETDYEFFRKQNIGSAYIGQIKQVCEEYFDEWAAIIFNTIRENIFNSELVTLETEGELEAIFDEYNKAFEKHVNSTVVEQYKRKLANYPSVVGIIKSFTTDLTRVSNSATYKGKIKIHCKKLILEKPKNSEPLRHINISGNNNTVQSGSNNTIKDTKIQNPAKPHWTVTPSFWFVVAGVVIAFVGISPILKELVHAPVKNGSLTSASTNIIYKASDAANTEPMLSKYIEHNVRVVALLTNMTYISVPLRNTPFTNTIRILPNGSDGINLLTHKPTFVLNGKTLTILNLSNVSSVRVEYESDSRLPN